jgi:hypothetical protein
MFLIRRELAKLLRVAQLVLLCLWKDYRSARAVEGSGTKARAVSQCDSDAGGGSWVCLTRDGRMGLASHCLSLMHAGLLLCDSIGGRQ